MLATVGLLSLGLRINMMAAGGLKVVGNNIQVTPAIQEAAEAKLGKALDRYEPMLVSTTLHMKVENRGGGLHDVEHKGQEAHVVELTAHCRDKHVIHLTTESPDMYASLDELEEKFSRQLRKHKERSMEEKRSGGGHAEAAALLAEEALAEEEPPSAEP